jgi:hypothetical protein
VNAPQGRDQLLFGPYGGLPEELCAPARDAGVNAVWFHMFSERDFDTCRRHGFAPCVELATFRADYAAHPELVPVGADGKPVRYGGLVQGVCLSHPELIAEIEESLRTGLERFQPAGVWLDYLTYAGWFETPEPDLQESCFCPACVREFCAATGIDAESPHLILSRHQGQWTRHKCERIAGLARRFSAIVREHAPGCVVGAYMCPWRPDEYDGALRRIFAQDLGLLAPAIDVFTPLIYARKSGRQPAWAREYLDVALTFVPAERRCQLILDELDFPASLEEAASASAPSWGIQIFAGARLFADSTAAGAFRGGVERIRASWR